MDKAKAYRVEWMHNGQWKMDEDGSGIFPTLSDAEKHKTQMKAEYPTLKSRIVEVAYMEKNHTPLPWKEDYGYVGTSGVRGFKIVDSKGRSICAYGSQGTRPSGEQEANATLIRRAVNVHAEMLEALETAYQFFNLEANTPDKAGLVVAPDSMVRVVLRKMNAAIAKAKH